MGDFELINSFLTALAASATIEAGKEYIQQLRRKIQRNPEYQERFWKRVKWCFSLYLRSMRSADELTRLNNDLPLEELDSLKRAISASREDMNWEVPEDILAHVFERDWEQAPGTARGLALAYLDCVLRSLEQPMSSELYQIYAGVVPADKRLDRIVGASAPAIEAKIKNFIAHYLVADDDKPVPFGGRQEQFRELENWLDEGREQYYVLTAPAGAGKSALIVRFIDRASFMGRYAHAFFPISLRFGTHRQRDILLYLATMLWDHHRPQNVERPSSADGVMVLEDVIVDLIRRKPEGDRGLLIVLDALDEASDWEAGSESLLFLREAHPRLKFLLTAREHGQLLGAEDWARHLGIQGKSRLGRLGNLTLDGVAEVIDSRRDYFDLKIKDYLQNKKADLSDVSVEEVEQFKQKLAERLYDLSENGDPLLLHLYMAAVMQEDDALPKLTMEELASSNLIKPGYESYFARWFDEMRKQLKAKGDLDYSGVTIEDFDRIFAVLAHARAAISEDVLFRVARLALEETGVSRFDEQTFRRLLELSRRFVVGPPYAFVHPRLSHYFWEKYNTSAARYELAYVQAGLQELAEVEQSGRFEKYSEYMAEFLSLHLIALDREGTRLNGEPAYDILKGLVLRRAWYEASVANDPGRRLLVKDLERLLVLARKHSDIPTVIGVLFYQLSLKSSADKLPQEYFEALALLGKVREATSWIAIMRREENKGRAIARFCRAGANGICEHVADAFSELARTVSNPDNQATTLTAIARAYAEQCQKEKAARVLTEARTAAAAISNPFFQARTLTAIARAYAEQGQKEEAANLLAETRKIADAISSPHDQARALTAIARAYAKQGQGEEAVRTLTEARQVANAISSPFFQASVLANLAHVYAEQGQYAEACKITDTIPYPDDQATTLTAIAHVYAEQGQYAEARKITDTFSHPHNQARALTAIAHVYAEQGQGEEAVRTLAEARKVTYAISHPHIQARALTAIAHIYAEQGHKEEATRTLAEARKVTYAISDLDTQARALTAIAHVYAEQGHKEEAARILAKARTAADAIPSPNGQASALIALTRAYAEQGLKQEAVNLLTDARKVADAISHPYLQASVLADLARAYAVQGQFTEARKVADTISDSHLQARALTAIASSLTAIARAYAEQGQFTEARKVADTFSSSFLQASVLADLALAYAEQGQKEEATRTLAEARQVAYAISDPDFQARALADLALAYAEQGQKEEATRTLAEARQVAYAISNLDNQALALAAIARAYAELGQFTEARKVADTFSSSFLQASVLADLARAYAELGQFTEARKVADTIPDPDDHASALTTIAYFYIKHGKKKEATRTLAEARQVAYAISDLDDQAHMLTAISRAYAEQGQYAEARKVSDSISNPHIQAHILAAIAHVYAEQGHKEEASRTLTEARKVADAISDPDARAYALIALARAYAEQGQGEKAMDLPLSDDFLRAVHRSLDPWSFVGQVAPVAFAFGFEQGHEAVRWVLAVDRLLRQTRLSPEKHV